MALQMLPTACRVKSHNVKKVKVKALISS